MKPAVVVENLLVRLATYTPRPDRNPLEDFCTETLAWCLRNSAVFRTAFLGQIEISLPDDASFEADVSTQVRFNARTLDDAGDSTEEDPQKGGRFDLVMISTDAQPGFAVVIEAKTRGRIRESQSTLYRKEMQRTPLINGIRDRGRLVLVGLSARRSDVGDVDQHLRWGDVAGICCESAEQEQNEVAFVLRQFADFLIHKSLCMKLDPITSDAIKSWASVTRLRTQLEDILHALQQEFHPSSRGRRRPRVDVAEHERDISWLGIYVTCGCVFYLGFAFKPKPQPSVYLCAEAEVKGDHPRFVDCLPPSLARAHSKAAAIGQKVWRLNGKTWMPFAESLSAVSGNDPEVVVEWFRNVISEFNGIRKVRDILSRKGPTPGGPIAESD